MMTLIARYIWKVNVQIMVMQIVVLAEQHASEFYTHNSFWNSYNNVNMKGGVVCTSCMFTSNGRSSVIVKV